MKDQFEGRDQIKLLVLTENDAFKPDANGEISKILRELANVIENSEPNKGFNKYIFDSNGNTVGEFHFSGVGGNDD